MTLRPEREASTTALPDVAGVDQLDREALVDFLTHVGALAERARARLNILACGKSPPEQPDAALTAAEAAPLLGVSEDWVRRHGAREGLAVRVGRRAVRYSRAAIVRYLKRRVSG